MIIPEHRICDFCNCDLSNIEYISLKKEENHNSFFNNYINEIDLCIPCYNTMSNYIFAERKVKK